MRALHCAVVAERRPSGHVACGILVPRPGMDPASPARKTLSHWVTRKIPPFLLFVCLSPPEYKAPGGPSLVCISGEYVTSIAKGMFSVGGEKAGRREWMVACVCA